MLVPDPSDQIVDGEIGPGGYILYVRPAVVVAKLLKHSRKVYDRWIVMCGYTRDLRKLAGVLVDQLPIAFHPVVISNRGMAQHGGGKRVVPVHPINERILGRSVVFVANLDREG